MELLTFKYYGFDWVAMVLTFTAIYYIGNKNRLGLMLMMVGNICWTIVGIQANSLAMILANVAFFIMNVRAVYKWSYENNQE